MGSSFLALVLALCFFALGQLFFGGGVVTHVLQVTSTATDPANIQAMATGQEVPNVSFVIALIIDIVIYYVIATLLIFFFGLFAKKKAQQ